MSSDLSISINSQFAKLQDYQLQKALDERERLHDNCHDVENIMQEGTIYDTYKLLISGVNEDPKTDLVGIKPRTKLNKPAMKTKILITS